MSKSTGSIAGVALRICSIVLMGLGGIIFLVGDIFLRGVEKIPFLPAEALGIASGLALIMLGAAAEKASKNL